MKKIILIFVLLIIFMFSGGINAYCTSDVIQDFSGSESLYDTLPSETKGHLSDIGINTADMSEINSLDTKTVLVEIIEVIAKAFSAPLASFGICTGVIILCSLAESTGLTGMNNSAGSVCNVVGGLCICSAVTVPLCSLISRSTQLIKSSAGLMEIYVPVMAGLETAQGKEICASSHYSLLMAVCVLIGKTAEGGLLPFLNIFLALSSCISMAPGLKLSSLSMTLYRLMKWILIFAMGIFTTILSARSFVSSSLDQVSSRALRFSISSFVPVSETLTAFAGSVNLLKNGTGVFVIIAVGVLFLPVIAECFIWRMALLILGSVGEIMDSGVSVFKTLDSVCAMLAAILICILIVFVISTVIILMTGA